MSRILPLAPSLADRFYQEGVACEEAGALEAAMLAFERAVRADGGHAEAHLALAYHYRRLERLEEALAHCKRAVEIRPGAETFFALGYLHVARRAFPEALAALRRCLEYDAHHARAAYQIAFVYYLRGQYDVAITEFHRAAQRESDWETLFFLGECYRMTRRPSEGEYTFRRALALCSNWGQIEITRAQISACQRLAEFPAECTLSLKDRAYCDCGVVYLGSASDDGLDIPPYLFYRFAYRDVARTLHRLVSLSTARAWQWQAVMPADIVSLPVALALSEWWQLGTEPLRGSRTLVVQALGESSAGLQEAVDRVGDAHSFCLALCWPEEWRPDFVGLATPLSSVLPWYGERPAGSDQADSLPSPWLDVRPAEAIARDILFAMRGLPKDPTLEAQLAYYEQHPHLRWL